MQVLECDDNELSSGHRREDPGGIRERRAIRLAELAVGRYGLHDASLRLLRQGFKQVFHVSSPTRGEFALRAYSPPHAGAGPRSDERAGTGADLRSPRTIRAQLDWLSSLHDRTDLLVPEPMPASDGSLTVHVSFQDLAWRRRWLRKVLRRYRDAYHPDHPGRNFALLRWVPGEQRAESLSPADLSAVGSFVARLHDHAERHPAADTSPLPRWDWHWPFGASAPVWSEGEAFYSSGELEVFEAAARRARDDLQILGEGENVFGPIHRDLQPSNLVFRSGEVGAIDFDLCGLGHYLLDLDIMLIALRIHHEDRYDAMRDAFLEAYDSRRTLPADHERYLRTFSAMMVVASANRALALRAAGVPPQQLGRRPRFLSNLVKRLDGLLEEG